jgi:hypothetical protein
VRVVTGHIQGTVGCRRRVRPQTTGKKCRSRPGRTRRPGPCTTRDLSAKQTVGPRAPRRVSLPMGQAQYSSNVQQRPLTTTCQHDHQHTELAGTTAKRPAAPLVRDEEANRWSRDMRGMILDTAEDGHDESPGSSRIGR